MASETIQQAITFSNPDEFWEEKVDWAAEQPAEPESVALAAVAQCYIDGNIDLSYKQACTLAEHFEVNPATQIIAQNIKSEAIRHRLGTLVAYSGSESQADLPVIVDPTKLRDPIAQGV